MFNIGDKVIVNFPMPDCLNIKWERVNAPAMVKEGSEGSPYYTITMLDEPLGQQEWFLHHKYISLAGFVIGQVIRFKDTLGYPELWRGETGTIVAKHPKLNCWKINVDGIELWQYEQYCEHVSEAPFVPAKKMKTINLPVTGNLPKEKTSAL